MDPDTRDLIVRLCTQAGMIMEDASLLGITMPSHNEGGMVEAMARLRRAAEAIATLVTAAAMLCEHAQSEPAAGSRRA